MKFSLVTHAFEDIERISGRLEMTRMLSDLFKQVSGQEIGIICNIALGQLHPPYIGTQFNVAEKMMLKVVARVLDEPQDETQKRAKTLGDLGAVIAEGTWQYPNYLSVLHVYNELCVIEKVSGEGSQEEKINQLYDLIKQLDPLSAKYIVRIVLGKLRLGFSDMTIIDALSWMVTGDKSLRGVIENAYNVRADIGLIAQTLKEDGIQALEKMQVQVGIPIRPAAAERLPTAQAIVDKLGYCIAQPKLDGFRLQIHLDKTGKQPIIHFFSRNLQDMSFMFPDIVDALKDLDVETIICEGEAIVYDPHTGSFVPFQETVKRKRKHGIEKAAEEFPLKVFIFDLLYLNGTSLLQDTHEERRAKLLQIFKHYKDDKIQVIEEKEIHTAQELEDYFIANIAAGLEGLVVKRADSVYTPGKRNFNWIKLKRQEEGELEDTIDCVVLGYYAGKGKRAAFGIGAFLVGVYNKQEDVYQTIAKIGTGLSDAEWRELKNKCDSLAQKDKPINVQCPKELTPDVWVYPELVCIIRADEITLSPVHMAGKTATELGYALRFPRVMGYAVDKSAEEATQVSEIKRLYEDQFKG